MAIFYAALGFFQLFVTVVAFETGGVNFHSDGADDLASFGDIFRADTTLWLVNEFIDMIVAAQGAFDADVGIERVFADVAHEALLVVVLIVRLVFIFRDGFPTPSAVVAEVLAVVSAAKKLVVLRVHATFWIFQNGFFADAAC